MIIDPGVKKRTEEKLVVVPTLRLNSRDSTCQSPFVIDYTTQPSSGEANQQGRHVPTILFTPELHQPRHQRP